MTDATLTAGQSDNPSAEEIKDGFKEKASQTVDQLKTTVGEKASAARDWAADQGDVLRDTVQTKPFIAVGISAASAFAAGVVLGVLLTRR